MGQEGGHSQFLKNLFSCRSRESDISSEVEEAPRQREKAANEVLFSAPVPEQLDPVPSPSSSVLSFPLVPSTPREGRGNEEMVEIEQSSSRESYRSTLSAHAARVLREARRELGKTYDDSGIHDALSVPSESVIAHAVDKVLRADGSKISEVERADVIVHLQKDLSGWGILQELIDDPQVTDIHVYDHRTVVLQRGKVSERTGLRWPSQQAYLAFVDRLLLRLGKSLSTQQHTVDASFNDGIRICAIHESVCVSRGPFLSIRVPRMSRNTLQSLVDLEVAPPLIVNYLGSLTRSGHATIIVAGETGTGKTTLLKCLGSQFGAQESIVTVEDTPELNFQHPFIRALVSRPPNVEGIGEVTLQEHIKSTLRMTPTRVVLGEMRSPLAAEAFLESAQTGHVGMSTVHARNARETLVRLESLLGRAQKSVSLDILRQQIALAVDVVVWMFREKKSGKPRIGEIIEVGHYVEGSIQVRPMFRYKERVDGPAWRVESWTSAFDQILAQDGIVLGAASQELRLQATTETGNPKSTPEEGEDMYAKAV